MKLAYRYLGLITLAIVPFIGMGAEARPRNPLGNDFTAPMQYNYAPQRQLSLREIEGIIASQVPGRISDVSERNSGDRKIYIIRWEPSEGPFRGKILIFEVDANTGQILSRRGG